MDIKALTKLVIAKKWDRANEFFSRHSDFLKINFCEEPLPTSKNVVHWRLKAPSICEIVFNISTPKFEYQFCLTRLFLLLPLIEAFHASKCFREGSMFINLDDWANGEGLAFCSNRENSILVPDIEFLSSLAYRQTRLDFMVNSPPWAMRQPIAFWRGNTTGIRDGGSWRSLPRVQLCELAKEIQNQNLFDVGISSFAQISKKEAKELKLAGLAKGFVPIGSCVKYKYQIDIDGNSNAWAGLFQKLLSGSAVLKVDSPYGFRQWYYDQLLPWGNFVPIKSDLSDLPEKIHWLKQNDEKAREIGARGRELALSLNYQKEINNAVQKIGRALEVKNIGSNG